MRIASLVLEFVTLISLTISLTCRSLLPHRLLANAFGVAQARASIHPLRPQAFANFASAWAHQGVAVFVENFCGSVPASLWIRRNGRSRLRFVKNVRQLR